MCQHLAEVLHLDQGLRKGLMLTRSLSEKDKQLSFPYPEALLGGFRQPCWEPCFASRKFLCLLVTRSI